MPVRPSRALGCPCPGRGTRHTDLRGAAPRPRSPDAPPRPRPASVPSANKRLQRSAPVSEDRSIGRVRCGAAPPVNGAQRAGRGAARRGEEHLVASLLAAGRGLRLAGASRHAPAPALVVVVVDPQIPRCQPHAHRKRLIRRARPRAERERDARALLAPQQPLRLCHRARRAPARPRAERHPVCRHEQVTHARRPPRQGRPAPAHNPRHPQPREAARRPRVLRRARRLQHQPHAGKTARAAPRPHLPARRATRQPRGTRGGAARGGAERTFSETLDEASESDGALGAIDWARERRAADETSEGSGPTLCSELVLPPTRRGGEEYTRPPWSSASVCPASPRPVTPRHAPRPRAARRSEPRAPGEVETRGAGGHLGERPFRGQVDVPDHRREP